MSKVAPSSFVLHGIGVSGGIAIGRAQLVSHATLEAAHYSITADQVADEIARLTQAMRVVQKELESLRAEMASEDAPAEFGAFLECTGRYSPIRPWRRRRSESSPSSAATPNGRWRSRPRC